MKEFSTISEVSRMTGVPCHILRYWERHFRSLRPARDCRGNRLYRKKDIDAVLRIKELVYGRGFRLKGAKKHLAEARKGAAGARHLKLLKEILAELKRIRAWLP